MLQGRSWREPQRSRSLNHATRTSPEQLTGLGTRIRQPDRTPRMHRARHSGPGIPSNWHSVLRPSFTTSDQTRQHRTHGISVAGWVAPRAFDSERPCNDLQHFRLLEHSRIPRNAHRNVYGPSSTRKAASPSTCYLPFKTTSSRCIIFSPSLPLVASPIPRPSALITHHYNKTLWYV